jgi:hypothetical protein
METFTLEQVIGAWLLECGEGPEVLLLCATNMNVKTHILMATEPTKPEMCTGYFTYGPDGEDPPCLVFQQKVPSRSSVVGRSKKDKGEKTEETIGYISSAKNDDASSGDCQGVE